MPRHPPQRRLVPDGERGPECIDVDVVEKRGEPFLLPCFAACSTRSSAWVTRARLCDRVCFADPRSPWFPALAPPTPPPVARLCSSASSLLFGDQTSLDRSSAATVPHLPATDHATRGPMVDPEISGSRTRSFRTCQGLRPRRVGRALALARPSVSPSVKPKFSFENCARGCFDSMIWRSGF